MARTNYSYDKRQRELAKQRKKEAKRLRKQNVSKALDSTMPDSDTPAVSVDAPTDAPSGDSQASPK